MKRIDGTITYVLDSTGREVSLAMDVIGIGLVHGTLSLTSGYDDINDFPGATFTAEERVEIAAFAIARWKEWAGE